ncbi:MAG TPA: aldehyde dehydrogenase family protein [Spongiibacteraceae bacterium]|nr:aldehyde dehydrogenase family protein [Spongiibacteraceae bacterium]MBN51641.1 aldehyde dehydrogenase family protein [Spongiibacteraceae bacterium]HCS28565.1 aldehyde dehydrogenase family protein [Spongiibacteraceae bacterium]|tara:strand:+ start:2101 stop:3582 length:1482 start_codon:yes stop_codon:yes gene_type:complete
MQSLDRKNEAGLLTVRSPIDGSVMAEVSMDTRADLEQTISTAQAAFKQWRLVPAPRRGELVRLLGDELRAHKQELGDLVTRECGKILQEGLGEVQEMIDICDFAVGLSRQLYGLTIQSERPGHHMSERWQPLGVTGVITAFNFPVAVWAWNLAIALVCGNSVIWKPSEKTPLTARLCKTLFERARQRFGDEAPESLAQLVVGERDLGELLVSDHRVALVSATGSTAMGRAVGPAVAARFGRCILELGGNNGIVVAPSADVEMAARAIIFGAVGTAGQRCTSTRRLIVHDSLYDVLRERLLQIAASVRIGDPLSPETLVGPLIDQGAFNAMQVALKQAQAEGGTLHGGQRVLADKYPDAWYVQPALVEMPTQSAVVKQETFAPILYLMRYSEWDDAIALHNAVPQGLSSAVFTSDMREAERFVSVAGSDCGIANVNVGTSGAEIGGAFGGEKETGGGRESGSDAWKGYMRRMTSTVNYSNALPLAQGIRFDLDR